MKMIFRQLQIRNGLQNVLIYCIINSKDFNENVNMTALLAANIKFKMLCATLLWIIVSSV